MYGHEKQKEQSRKMIEDALFELLEVKDYTKLTVSEIAKKADVSRRTFYRLYKEKDEVLHIYFGRLCQEYSSRYGSLQSYDLHRIALDFFSFWYEYKELLMLMHKRGLDEFFYYEVSSASIDIVKRRMKEKCKDFRGMEYFAHYSSGGFLLLLQQWVVDGMKETPEQYAKIVSESLLRFVQ